MQLTALRPNASGVLGGPLVHLGEIGSTNDYARELALAGAVHGTVVLAESQTAGRGRQGRSWIAPPGSALTLSALLRLDRDRLALLPLAAAVATCEACEAVCEVEARIKWPNDVWLDGRKAAGILIEARPQEGWAVVGIGLNVNTAQQFPAELEGIATSLRIACGRRSIANACSMRCSIGWRRERRARAQACSTPTAAAMPYATGP